MTRGINDIDVGAFVLNRTVLGQDSDAALFFEIVGVHHASIDLLVFTEGTRLLEQLVYQRGFAVIDVGDDGDVAQSALSSGHG